jgi:hypothetical protein
MPVDVIDRADPPALPSLIPDEILSLRVELETPALDAETGNSIQKFGAAANYIAAGREVKRCICM